MPVKGMAHITGGGLVENLPRVLPEAVKAVIARSSWPMPPLFQWLQREGKVADAEMHRVFNCGIGMAVGGAAEHPDAAGHRPSGRRGTGVPSGRLPARQTGEPPDAAGWKLEKQPN